MTSAADFKQHRSPALDCIRAGAVMMVLIYHITIEYPRDGLDVIAQWFAKYGFLGVDIFFPLSGFLITGFLLRSQDAGRIKVFFLRRSLRILPLYILALLTYMLGSALTGIDRDIIGNIWQNFLFLTGWMIFHTGREMVPYTITWSLSVEEFAYILFGLSALIFRGRFIYVLMAICVASFALRLSLQMQDAPLIYYYPPARLDSIAIGGLTAWAMQRAFPVIIPLAIGLGLGLAIASINKVLFSTFLFVNITLMTCLAISLCQRYLATSRNRFLAVVGDVGFYSYFIYLFHFFNIYAALAILQKLGVVLPFWAFVGLILGLTYVQAVLSFRFFEGPAMAWGRRFEARFRQTDQAGVPT